MMSRPFNVLIITKYDYKYISDTGTKHYKYIVDIENGGVFEGRDSNSSLVGDI
jgi:hypothetical protein